MIRTALSALVKRRPSGVSHFPCAPASTPSFLFSSRTNTTAVMNCAVTANGIGLPGVPGAVVKSNRMKSALRIVGSLLLLFAGAEQSQAQNVDATWGTNTGTAWYTATNWSGGKFAGVQGAAASNTNTATFTSASTGNPIGINMGTANLNLGAIQVNSRTTTINIGNSSATAGVLRLYGATFTSANTIIRQNGTGLLTLPATQNGTMGLVLGNTTNIIQIDNTAGVTISAVISQINTGSGITLNYGASGTGALTLSGSNSYTGATTINGGTLIAAALANGGANSSIGASTNAATNLVLNTGTLSYSGATVSTDRSFTISDATTGTISVSTAASVLTVSGASASTTGALTKSGNGTLTLSGQNLHSGLTTVSAGTLILNRTGGNTLLLLMT
jgi:autotransporter-associated beta strand protein